MEYPIKYTRPFRLVVIRSIVANIFRNNISLDSRKRRISRILYLNLKSRYS